MRALRSITVTICLLAAPAETWPQAPPPGAPVQVDGRTLFVVRGAVGSFAPVERAAAVSRRLDNILNTQPDAIEARVEQTDIGWMVSVGNQPVISVTDSDAQAEGISGQALAERWASAIQKGLQQAASERIRSSLWRRISITLLVMVAALWLLWALRRGWRRGNKALEDWRGRVAQVQRGGLGKLSGPKLYGALRRAPACVFLAGLVLVVSATLLLIFSQFPATRGYARHVLHWIWTSALDILRGFVHYLPNLCYIVVIVIVTRLAIAVLGFLFEQVHRGVINLEPWVHRDVARPTAQIIKAALMVLALFFIAPLIPGTGSTAAEAISVVLGLMVSFGSTATVGRVIAGVVLTYMRPYRLGDRVKLGDTVGDVVERTFLYTKVLTIKNEEVVVPSLQALGGAMVNYSARAKQGGLILHTSVTIG